jgi:hypothetical protein
MLRVGFLALLIQKTSNISKHISFFIAIFFNEFFFIKKRKILNGFQNSIRIRFLIISHSFLECSFICSMLFNCNDFSCCIKLLSGRLSMDQWIDFCESVLGFLEVLIGRWDDSFICFVSNGKSY